MTPESKLLEGITVLDFSHRLPGPLAGMLLSHQGAKVIKIEDESFKDAFLEGFFESFDPSFVEWYKELNKEKEILRLDFQAPATVDKIQNLIKNSDGAIMGLPPKLRAKFKVQPEDLKKLNKPFVNLHMGASKDHGNNMHDLNAMALTGMLSLFIADKNEDFLPPPFVPLSGILYGQKLALSFCCALLKARQENTLVETQSFLFETAKETLTPFWPPSLRQKQTKFLHNGAYPCYGLYQTKDGQYLAVAAVEEKFWTSFQETFEIQLFGNDRFSTDEESFSKVSSIIKKLTLDEAIQKLDGRDICISPVKKS